MDSKDNSDIGREVELHSGEVQEVMRRIPSALVRWGMTIMALIVAGLLAAAAFIRWPETAESEFLWRGDGAASVITARLSPETVKALSDGTELSTTLYSPMFPDEYAERGVPCSIAEISTVSGPDGFYSARLECEAPPGIDSRYEIRGTLLLMISDKTLLQRLFEIH